MRLKFTNILSALAGAGLCLWVASAQAGFLFTDDFNSGVENFTKSGPLSTGAISGLSPVNIRPVTDLMYSLPANSSLLPAGPVGFTQSFLVIGDYAGPLNNTVIPTGPVGTNGGQTSKATFNLGTFGAGTHGLRIAYDWAFDTSQAALSTDDFAVQLLSGSTVLDTLDAYTDVLRNAANRRGHYDDYSYFTLTAPGTVSLAFSVTEYNGTAPNTSTGDSAAGIDNLRVVPEPTSIALLGMGLLGLVGARKRRMPPV